jgi:hypothetical protein
MHDAVVLVAEHEDGDIVGMAYGEVNVPSRFSRTGARDLRRRGAGGPPGPRGRPGPGPRGRPLRRDARRSLGHAQDVRSE